MDSSSHAAAPGMWWARMQWKLSSYGQRHPSSAVTASYTAKLWLTSSRLPTRLSTPETQRSVNAWATVRKASSSSTKIAGARIREEKGTIITATALAHRVVTRHARSEKQKIVNSMVIMPRSSSIETRSWAPAHGLWTNEHVRSPSQMLLSSLHAFPTADLARFYRHIYPLTTWPNERVGYLHIPLLPRPRSSQQGPPLAPRLFCPQGTTLAGP